MNQISGTTNLVGVVGSPVRHSLSPVIHNAAFAEMGLDWCYLAIPCEPKNLETTVNTLSNMNCKGLNITIPHKEKSIALCESISNIARDIGAINTLIPAQKGNWIGDNTDIIGFLNPLKNKIWENRNALILGCGGSARSVFAGLKILKFKEITIVSRNKVKLNKFIEEMKENLYSSNIFTPKVNGILQEDINLIEHIKNSDLIINTTPIGMSTNTYELKVPLGNEIWSSLKTNTTLYDLIYTPKPTKWLKIGAKMNCQIIDGLEMLIEQGAASLRLWSNLQDIPTKTMKNAAINHLHL
tara:strand:- start:3799 stop:4692 length:894 start_codon:yes stop_codon:yes gene_type:complete